MNNISPPSANPTSPKTPRKTLKKFAITLAVVVLAAYPVAEGVGYIQQVQAVHDRINHGTDAFWANPCYDGPNPTTNASTPACYYTMLTQQDQ